jgi:hypothetical protein
MVDDPYSQTYRVRDDSDPEIIQPSLPEFPGYTHWEHTAFCCCRNAILTLPNKALFLGHWEVSLPFPITVNFIITSSYLVAMLLVFPYSETRSFALPVLFSILFFLFSYSYARVIIDGPGYFPFYYPDHCPDHPGGDSVPLLHSDDLSPSGIVATSDQQAWMKFHPKPNRCIFSSVGRRIVIRPDHFCGWTTSWIGKRNHKFFMLFNFWGLIYISIFIVALFFRTHNEATNQEPSILLSVYFVYLFLAMMFAMLTGTFTVSSICSVCRNQTSWEQWNGVDRRRFDQGCLNNLEDVCGPRAGWHLYPCPVSPWKGMSNDDLVRDYPPYGARAVGRVRSSRVDYA